MNKEKWLEAPLITAIFISVVLWIKLTYSTDISLHSANMTTQTIITKDALDELIQQAANQKYLQKVFHDLPELPSANPSIALPPTANKQQIMQRCSTDDNQQW